MNKQSDSPGIYAIRCILDGKNTIYIGSSIHVITRMRHHKSALSRNKHDNPFLQSAYNKYGLSGFKFEIIEYTNAEHLDQQEQFWLDHFSKKGRVYNFGLVSKSNWTGRKHSSETKIKMSTARKKQIPPTLGIHPSQSTRDKISNAKMGHPVSLETREKLRKFRTGKKLGPHPITPYRHQRIIETHSKQYPAMINIFTGERIPSGKNISQLAAMLDLEISSLAKVVKGTRSIYHGWMTEEAFNISNSYGS